MGNMYVSEIEVYARKDEILGSIDRNDAPRILRNMISEGLNSGEFLPEFRRRSLITAAAALLVLMELECK